MTAVNHIKESGKYLPDIMSPYFLIRNLNLIVKFTARVESTPFILMDFYKVNILKEKSSFQPISSRLTPNLLTEVVGHQCK